MTSDENPYRSSEPTGDGRPPFGRHLATVGSAFFRSAIVVASCLSILYWIAFAAGIFPWIVIADSDWSLAVSFEEAARAGLFLAMLSFAPPLLVIAKMLGHHRGVNVAGVLLLIAWLAVAPWIFVQVHHRPGVLVNVRTACYAVGLLLIIGSLSPPWRVVVRKHGN